MMKYRRKDKGTFRRCSYEIWECVDGMFELWVDGEFIEVAETESELYAIMERR